MELSGKIALITGGAQGIGRIISEELARQGAHVILGDINFDGAEKTVAEIKGEGGKASAVQIDVSSAADVQSVFDSIINNIEAKPITLGVDARESLVKQVCSSVRWSETMQCIVDHEIDTVVELGSGKVLSGLMKRFDKSINCYQVGDRESLSQTLSAIK